MRDRGGEDVVRGGDQKDLLIGGTGHDHLYGQKGNDNMADVYGPINGNPADFDRLFGGPGDDILDVGDGDGNDLICSGVGQDFIPMAGTDPGDKVDDPSFC